MSKCGCCGMTNTINITIDNADKAKVTVEPEIETKVDTAAKAKSKSSPQVKDIIIPDPPEPEEMTICHITPSGVKQTLTLPVAAAMIHLEEHPLDTEGSCEEDNEVTIDGSMIVEE